MIDDVSPFGARPCHWYARLVWRICNAPFLPSSLRRRLRKTIAVRFPGPFDMVQDGMRLRLYPTQNYCDRHIISRASLPEAAEHRALAEVIGPDATIIDIGANVGTYAVYFGVRCGKSARILALEPHPETFRKLDYNIKANGLDNVTALPLAAGVQRKTQKLWSDGGSNIGHSSLLEAGTSHANLSVEVETIPLADILAEQEILSVDAIKIDVEGYEDQILEAYFGGTNENSWPNVIQIETANHEIWRTDCIALLGSKGYHPVLETAENTVFRRDPQANANVAGGSA